MFTTNNASKGLKIMLANSVCVEFSMILYVYCTHYTIYMYVSPTRASVEIICAGLTFPITETIVCGSTSNKWKLKIIFLTLKNFIISSFYKLL